MMHRQTPATEMHKLSAAYELQSVPWLVPVPATAPLLDASRLPAASGCCRRWLDGGQRPPPPTNLLHAELCVA